MAKTSPIKSKSTLNKCYKWLDKNKDPLFGLVYRVANTTGLRITDVTEIKWADINLEDKTLTVVENKGTRQAFSRAKSKVLDLWHKRLFQMERDDRGFIDSLFITKPKDLLTIAPVRYLDVINSDIEAAQAAAKKKVRIVDIHPSLIAVLKCRKAKYKLVDNGYVFARSTLSSMRAKNTDGVITRQSCWKAFKAMGEAISTITDKIKGSCHGARKTFARMLYKSNSNDLNLVMQIMGWSDVVMVMRYLGFDEEQRKQSSVNAFAAMAI